MGFGFLINFHKESYDLKSHRQLGILPHFSSKKQTKKAIDKGRERQRGTSAFCDVTEMFPFPKYHPRNLRKDCSKCDVRSSYWEGHIDQLSCGISRANSGRNGTPKNCRWCRHCLENIVLWTRRKTWTGTGPVSSIGS